MMIYNKYMTLRAKAKFSKKIKNQKGQTFVEFLMLLLIMMGISYAMVAAFNGRTGQRWTEIVNIIASDNITSPRSDIELN